MNKGNAATIGIAYCEVCEHRSEGHERVMRLDWPLVEAPRGCCLVDGCGCPRFKLGRIEAPEDHTGHKKRPLKNLSGECEPCFIAKLRWMAGPRASSHQRSTARRIMQERGLS